MNTAHDLGDLRIRRTHKLLWQALMALITEQEFEAITVKEICDRAMVHRTTFYNHYEDKYDLLTRGMREMHDPLAELDLTAATASGDLFFSHFLHIFAHVALHERFYRAMLCGKGVSSFQAWLRTYFAEYIATNMQLLAQKGQTFPAPLPLLAHFYAGAFLSTLAWWLSHDLPYSPEQMGHYMCNLLVEGSPT